MNKKIILALLLAGFLIIGLGIWYYTKKDVATSISVNSEETATWKTYKNEEYGFSFKYPPNLQETKEGFIDEAYLTTVTYCEGKNENTPAIAPEGIPERCDGTEYRIDVRVYKESLDPKTVTKYYDANPYPYEIKKIAINGKDFYIGLQAVYAYSGWYVHNAVQENTLELAFSGNGYVKPATSDTTISQEELEKIIPILASLRVRK